jgi:hypothetical protein
MSNWSLLIRSALTSAELTVTTNAEVRSVLAPLAKLAADHSVAVACVTHLNKSSPMRFPGAAERNTTGNQAHCHAPLLVHDATRRRSRFDPAQLCAIS